MCTIQESNLFVNGAANGAAMKAHPALHALECWDHSCILRELRDQSDVLVHWWPTVFKTNGVLFGKSQVVSTLTLLIQAADKSEKEVGVEEKDEDLDDLMAQLNALGR